MTAKHVGWGLVVVGGVVAVAEAYAGTKAAASGGTFQQTTIGKFISPIEDPLKKVIPFGGLGTWLIVAGALVVFVVPFVKQHV